jgi:hypothetical protein
VRESTDSLSNPLVLGENYGIVEVVSWLKDLPSFERWLSMGCLGNGLMRCPLGAFVASQAKREVVGFSMWIRP